MKVRLAALAAVVCLAVAFSATDHMLADQEQQPRTSKLKTCFVEAKSHKECGFSGFSTEAMAEAVSKALKDDEAFRTVTKSWAWPGPWTKSAPEYMSRPR